MMTARDSRDGVAPCVCWVCGHAFDAATDAYGEARPSSGDVTVCLYCGTLGVFEDSPAGVIVRPPSVAEYDEAMSHENVRRLVRAIEQRK